MSRRILWMMMSGLMALSLMIAACGQAEVPITPTTPTTPTTPATPTTPGQEPAQKEIVEPTGEVPKYGGTLIQYATADVSRWDPFENVSGEALVGQELFMGDWAKGTAGGYGAGQTDWNMSSDIFDLKRGFLGESVKWSVDEAKNEGTIVCQIRPGIHYASNPEREASRLVNGRELTADDVVYSLTRKVTNLTAYFYLSNPELRPAKITKTGPWEVTIKLPLTALMTGITRFTDCTLIMPKEVVEKYSGLSDWKNLVGTGPFILKEYVPGSQIVFIRNPSYFEKDPVGPGKGNQLPYLDGVRRVILPDASTQQAAFRTGKMDRLENQSWEDAAMWRKTNPALKEQVQTSWDGRCNAVKPPVDRAPFNDVRVRRALFMATDYETIVQNYYGGNCQYETVLWADSKDYHDIHLGLDDPEMTELGRELYTYNPEKAKQLLKEAGYPSGFQTEILVTRTRGSGIDYIDYFSIIKDMWAKVGVNLNLDIKESAVYNTIKRARTHKALTEDAANPVATFYLGIQLQGASEYNTGMLDDPIVNKALDKVRIVALTDIREAMKIYKKEISVYVLEQAYFIPVVSPYRYTFWWPWLKGYSGESQVGYQNLIWPYYVWYDAALKKQMGF